MIIRHDLNLINFVEQAISEIVEGKRVRVVSGSSKFKFFREILFFRYGKCFWCDKELIQNLGKTQYPSYVTLDHLRPLSLGGSKNSKRNLVLSCAECNQSRSSKVGQEFLDWLSQKIKENDNVHYSLSHL